MKFNSFFFLSCIQYRRLRVVRWLADGVDEVGEIISRFEKKSFYLKGLKFLNVERAFAGPVVIWERKNVGFHHHQQINLQIRTAKGVCAGFKGAQENGCTRMLK
ncbi:Nucleoside diphosphate kinase 1 [Trifolium repens]|nr:Nucleoside diphosphate kinase 1 [Trifolium repens]